MLKLRFKPSENFWAQIRALLSAGEGYSTICVCGADSGVGTSTIATSYAGMLAQKCEKGVLLIGAHPESPSISRLTKAKGGPGLAEWLWADDPPEDPVQETETKRLDVVPAGSYRKATKGETGHLVVTPKWSKALADWHKRYDAIIVDAGPLLDGINPIEIAKQADAVIVVCQWARTRREVLEEIGRRLESVEANVLGVVVNRRRFVIPGWLYRRL